MAERKLPDINEPASDWEKALFEKILSDPANLPQKFKAWLTDYVSANGTLNVSDMPTLKGEEFHLVGAYGSSFGTNWSSATAPHPDLRFYKDATGIVRIEGSVLKNGTPGGGEIMFTLPVGYRSAGIMDFPCMTADNISSGFGFCRVDDDGTFAWGSGSSGANNRMDLDAISYRAAQG